jgi:hypothetical protein
MSSRRRATAAGTKRELLPKFTSMRIGRIDVQSPCFWKLLTQPWTRKIGREGQKITQPICEIIHK